MRACMQTCRHAELQACRIAGMQTCRNAEMQACRHEDMQTYAEMQNCRHADMQKFRTALTRSVWPRPVLKLRILVWLATSSAGKRGLGMVGHVK